jgi:hypothetical protein
MHPFWSSHEEKRDCVRLSMGGGHGRSWSSINDSMASSRERRKRGKEERGRGRTLGRPWGWLLGGGGGPWALGTRCSVRAPCCCSREFCCS